MVTTPAGDLRKTMHRGFVALALTAFIPLAILGCAKVKRFDQVSIGMSQAEVIRILGQPNSTSAAEEKELLRYPLEQHEQSRAGSSDEYLVIVVNDRVVSFGRLSDFALQPKINPAAAPTPVHPALPDQASVTDSAKRDAIRQLFLTLQEREPDWQGWNFWTSCPEPIDEIKQQMMSGIEYQTKQKIIQLFQTVLRRAPVPQELHAWYSKSSQDGYDVEAVGAALQQPDQGKREAIRWLYKYLQQREPDEQGWDYWTDYDASIPEIIPMMMSGIEYRQKQQIIILCRQLLNRDPSDAELHSLYSLWQSDHAPEPLPVF